jgi:protocatechuate 3,4-dioxygenase, alpha subunit
MMSAFTTNQTIGPFFHEGLKWAFTHSVAADATLNLSGRVLDCNGAPVADAMVEMWQPGVALRDKNLLGVCRVATDSEGHFSFLLRTIEQGAPLAYVCVFARGVLNQQFSAVFTSDVKSSVLDQVPEARRPTLIARKISENNYEWNIQLQGTNETVFFEYQ